tara:strand:+ start:635 stop:925 length:291 start_codon:yes stop_codon:yes gene_type:complete
MKYFRLRTGELGRLTSLNIEDVSAYSVETKSGGLIRAQTYNVEIHMISGTIFTTIMNEAEMLTWDNIFYPRSEKEQTRQSKLTEFGMQFTEGETNE